MPNDPQQQPPQIIVDSDWKSQAQAEKERLAEAEEKAAPRHAGGGPGAGGLPRADFMSLVGMIGTQAVMYLGGMADRRTGAAIFDPEYAAHMIDLLGVLQEKTKGNLSAEESGELDAIVQELRSRYVELSRMVAAKQAAAAGIPGAGAGIPGASGTPLSPGA